MPPYTHTPLRYACGSSGSRAAPPPPAELPITPPPPPPTPPPRKFWQIAEGGVASGPVVVAPPPPSRAPSLLLPPPGAQRRPRKSKVCVSKIGLKFPAPLIHQYKRTAGVKGAAQCLAADQGVKAEEGETGLEERGCGR